MTAYDGLPPRGPATDFGGVIDTMIGFPMPTCVRPMRSSRRRPEQESKEEFESPAEYMFKDVPEKKLRDVDDPLGLTLGEMDRWGIRQGVIGVGDELSERALSEHPDRFVASSSIDPNDGMAVVRRIRRDHEQYGTRAVGMFPAGCNPPVPIGDRRMWPVYSTCCELGIPVFVCAGVPGPRLRFAAQHVEQIDEVMYDFPELVFVTRHGCEPWTDLIVKLMLKWPNLHYSTSAFAPKYYPKAIIDYAEHVRCRQGPLRRVLPDGVVARADHGRDARRRVRGRRVAEVPPGQRQGCSASRHEAPPVSGRT